MSDRPRTPFMPVVVDSETPDEDYSRVKQTLKDLLELAEQGRIREVLAVVQLDDGDMQCAASRSMNPHEIVGRLFDLSLTRLLNGLL